MSFASTRWIIRAGLVLAGAASLAVACVTDERPRPKCNELADGGVVIEVPEASTYFGSPTTDAQAPRDLANPADRERLEPDPGPTCVDCRQADDVEVLLIHDFEQAFAPTWFNYGEPGVPIAPPQVGPGADNDAGVPPPYWGLQVPDLNRVPGGKRCGSKHALHLAGGRFQSWGGGFVSLSVTVRGPSHVNRYCPGDLNADALGIGTQPASIGTGDEQTCSFFITPAAGQPSRLGMDVSDYEGISFWARRSPSAQATLRIALNDRNTSEGLALAVERENYEARQADPQAPITEPRCRRVLGCCRHCAPHDRDGLVLDGDSVVGIQPVTEKRCWLDGERPHPELRLNADGATEFRSYTRNPNAPEDAGADKWIASSWALVGSMYSTSPYKTAFDEWERDAKLCCPQTMEEEDEATKLGDPQFGGRECNDYVFNYDYSSGYYCRGEGDPPLPERNENRCGDTFEMSLNIDTEWRFYRIPWGELRRFTPNRPPIDPTGIFSVALYFGAGYLDTYVDDIGFYRKRR